MDKQTKSQRFCYAGIKAYEKSAYRTAITNLEKVTNLGHYESTVRLGYIYRYGIGVLLMKKRRIYYGFQNQNNFQEFH